MSDWQQMQEWRELAARAERQYLEDPVFHAMVQVVAQRIAAARREAEERGAALARAKVEVLDEAISIARSYNDLVMADNLNRLRDRETAALSAGAAGSEETTR
jgi:hypothetical protein